MRKAKFIGVQQRTRNGNVGFSVPDLRLAAVRCIADDRMADMRHMNPNLVRAPRVQGEFDERKPIELFLNVVVSQRWASARHPG